MELAVGAMGTLVPKLAELLHHEFVKQTDLNREVESLCRELPMMKAALVEVSQVPPGQLSNLDKEWAQHVRELSYDMEDAVDAFMVHVHRCEPFSGNEANIFKKIAHKASVAMRKFQSRRQISDRIKDIKDLSKELPKLRSRYQFSGTAYSTKTGRIDPRVINFYKNKGRDLIGIEKVRDELLRMLKYPEGSKGLKVISIIGSGGLGKTTLAEVVHEQLKVESFDCCAFVSVGRNPNITSTLREMLKQLLHKEYSSDMNGEQLCREFHESLKGKRYNIVVDDVWDKETWETINCALPDSDCGSKVIMTTRNSQVNTSGSDVYMIKPLSRDKSKELFYKRTSSKNGDNQLIDKILDKCDGVPLAIIAIASLLADRPLEDWQTVYDSLVFGNEEENTRAILLYSYYDLPPYLKPCLLYLSMYPEDHLINKYSLVWRWIAEGFVQPEKKWCISLFEVGQRYFDELLNRSMIQPAEMYRSGIIDGCHVHDIVLDLIRDLSTEENFVTIIGKKQSVSSESVKIMKQVSQHGFGRKMRRLSIQWSNGKSISQDTIGMPEVVRSLHAFDCVIDAPLLSSFQAIRVLSKTRRSKIGHLQHISKLRHLRYLEITCDECPKEIENLKSLQTLIIHPGAYQLPPTVFELAQLMCLCIIGGVIWNVPADKMENLKCLEKLDLQIVDTNEDSLVALGRMTRLRVLKILFVNNVKKTWYKALMHSLNNLKEIRELKLWRYNDIDGIGMAWESWEPPRQVWSLETNMGLSPQLIDPSHFQHIRYLSLSIDFMEADMGNLALLRELLSLELCGCYDHHYYQGFIIRAEGFENLRVCQAETELKFLQGAMPRLESLAIKVSPGSDLDFNLATLHSLKKVIVRVDCYGYFRTDVVETEAVVRRAVEDHPNCPTLQISRNEYGRLRDDEMKPDIVVCALVNVREGRRDGYYQICKDVNMSFYRWLQEINCDVDCEGSKLLEVERVEANLRRQAARHINRPKLVMNRINEDKMLGDDDASVDS